MTAARCPKKEKQKSSEWPAASVDSLLMSPNGSRAKSQEVIQNLHYKTREKRGRSLFSNSNPSIKPTVRNNWVSTRPCLCSKFSIFKMSWQMLKVLPQLSPLDQSLPYLRAFQWGTVWLYISSGIKNTTGQTWKVKIYFIKVDFWTLTCRIFDTPWVIRSQCTSLESY